MADLIETVQQMIQAEAARVRFLGVVTAIQPGLVQVKRPTQLGPDGQLYRALYGVVPELAIGDTVTVEQFGANWVVTGKLVLDAAPPPPLVASGTVTAVTGSGIGATVSVDGPVAGTYVVVTGQVPIVGDVVTLLANGAGSYDCLGVVDQDTGGGGLVGDYVPVSGLEQHGTIAPTRIELGLESGVVDGQHIDTALTTVEAVFLQINFVALAGVGGHNALMAVAPTIDAGLTPTGFTVGVFGVDDTGVLFEGGAVLSLLWMAVGT